MLGNPVAPPPHQASVCQVTCARVLIALFIIAFILFLALNCTDHLPFGNLCRATLEGLLKPPAEDVLTHETAEFGI